MTKDEGHQDQEIKGSNPGRIENESFEAGVEEAKRIAEEEEAGYRHLVGWDRWVIPTIAVIWSIFQLSVASWLLIDTIIVGVLVAVVAILAGLAYLGRRRRSGQGPSGDDL